MKYKSILLASFLVFGQWLYGQQSNSLLINLLQTPINYSFYDITGVPAEPQEQLIPLFSDQLGISFRKVHTRNWLFEIAVGGSVSRRFSNEIYSPPREGAVSSYRISKGSVLVRLESGKLWNLPKHRPIKLGISASFDPRYTFNDFQSQISTKFPLQYNSFELAVNVIPQFTYNVSDRFIASLKMPVEILNYHMINGEYGDPSLAVEEQRIKFDQIFALPLNRSFTISIGYFLTHADRKKQTISEF